MDTGQFRKDFTEFSDIARYPDSQIEFWATIAEKQVNAKRWRSLTSLGVSLYVAHEITLAAQNARASEVGGSGGGASGPINSKTVGSVTVAYDTVSASEKDAGYWNLTSYGKKFIHMARVFGAGGVQL